MKFLPFILKHLRRNWVRTASTVLAMTVCICLFSSLEMFLEATTYNLKSANDSRLVTRHNVSLVFPLAVSCKEKIASVPGVRRVASSNWFGGRYKNDMKNFFPNFAVDLEEYLAMYPEYIISDATRSALLRDQRACIIGKETASKFDFKVGDVFQLESFIPRYRKSSPFEFVIAGIYDTDPVKYPGTNASIMLFHYKYLYEGTGQQAQVATFMTEVEDRARAPAIAKAIDALFENSDAPTKTETEAAFRASFVSLGGNLALLLHSIGTAVTFAILLVTANTMSMAIRERRTEIGVLKTLGFSNRNVLSIILGEAALLGIAGGALGILLVPFMIRLMTWMPFLGTYIENAMRGYPGQGLSFEVAGLGFGMAVLLGLAAGIVPAVLSYRARITTLLRNV